MRIVTQRVKRALVSVGGVVVGEIAKGLVALVGVSHDDASQDAVAAAAKLANLRLMPDGEDVMNLSILDHAARRLTRRPK